MQQGNFFGDPEQVPVAPPGKKKRASTKPNGYAMRPGTGPEGETCKTCRHRVPNENRTARTYWKCAKMRHTWTGGTGTDVRASSAACKLWEEIEK